MWPWGHLGAAYLAYFTYTRIDATDRQTVLTLLALAVGSQFPDLVDKPLAWTVSVLPSGRSLAHSLVTLVLLVAILYRVGAWYQRTDLVRAFGVGAFAHSLTDVSPSALAAVLGGDLSQLQWFRFLVWPFRPPPPYSGDTSFAAQFATFQFEPYVQFQFALLGLAVVVWIADGAPGVRTVTEAGRELLAERT